ncbi:hypothetical protein SAMN04488121_11557 [Chitinophaga filiformis]|uniref:Uncharacterized protein n=1 Tax=Chitinophaga filiformis TaxID=104663 RepID=A0A1G8DP34_CHIFI|nr:hypothetical protein SAMN04488121_11557 [Chitinophaga filiformis]
MAYIWIENGLLLDNHKEKTLLEAKFGCLKHPKTAIKKALSITTL